MKPSEANEISWFVLSAPTVLRCSPKRPPACRSRHRAPPNPQNAIVSIGTDCQRVERQGGSKECLPLQSHHSAGDFVEHAANAASHRAASAGPFADGTASRASASTPSVIELAATLLLKAQQAAAQ